jgi:hypothetical protein
VDAEFECGDAGLLAGFLLLFPLIGRHPVWDRPANVAVKQTPVTGHLLA